MTVSNQEMENKLRELNSKRETKFLRYLSSFMGAQNQYFARGTKLFQNLKPRMDAIQEHIAQIGTFYHNYFIILIVCINILVQTLEMV